MRILTLENKCFNLNNLPEQIDEDVRFAVLDNSDSTNPDFFYVPLIFLESFSAPAMVLEINGKEITMPIDWCIAVGDSESGNDLEVLPLTSLNDRGFEALKDLTYRIKEDDDLCYWFDDEFDGKVEDEDPFKPGDKVKVVKYSLGFRSFMLGEILTVKEYNPEGYFGEEGVRFQEDPDDYNDGWNQPHESRGFVRIDSVEKIEE